MLLKKQNVRERGRIISRAGKTDRLVTHAGMSKLQQLPRLEAECLRNKREISQADLDLPRLHLGQVAAVDPQPLAHLELCPALFLPEGTDSPA